MAELVPKNEPDPVQFPTCSAGSPARKREKPEILGRLGEKGNSPWPIFP
jgi:hypothetical protein